MIDTWGCLTDGSAVLVAGCGNGMYASQLRRRYTPHVEAFDIEADRVALAQEDTPHALVAAAESIPYPDNAFDMVLSHEVIEHVADDRATAHEMMRVLKPGGRLILFGPNRWYPFETHGHYWRGEYHFGNTPLINYLPDDMRDRLAPHVRAYRARDLLGLFDGTPHRVVHHSRIFGGYDNIIARAGTLAQVVRDALYTLENSPLDVVGLSHLLVLEKTT
ncbi:MAG: methyltransferase domain-containing protein [Chloroflexota bacterium]